MSLIMDSAGVISVSHAAAGKIAAVYIKTGDTVESGQLIARLEQPERVADTQMAQYGAGLASSDRDVIGRVYQYDAKLHQQNASENIYSEYDGVVDEVLIEKGSIISAGNPICTIRLTRNRDELRVSGLLTSHPPYGQGASRLLFLSQAYCLSTLSLFSYGDFSSYRGGGILALLG